MAKKILIDIRISQAKSWGRTLRAWALIVALIGPGVALDSTAMQWAGFVVIAIWAIAYAAARVEASSALTPDEARALIDKLEAEAR